MKNWIVSLATVLATGLSPVFASGTGDDPRAEKTFEKEFAGAQNVKWARLDDGYLRVTFILNGVAAETYFDANSELVGTVRNLFYTQLPLAVMQAVHHKFSGGVLVEVKEITNADGTSYSVTLDQYNKRYTVRLNTFGEVLDVQKKKLKK